VSCQPDEPRVEPSCDAAWLTRTVGKLQQRHAQGHQACPPGMVERKRGLILSVGSFAALVPSPLLAVYSGSKAFLKTWSQALGSELEGTGVHVELLNAYFVVRETPSDSSSRPAGSRKWHLVLTASPSRHAQVSKLSKIRKSSWFIPTPKTYVREYRCLAGPTDCSS